MTQYPIFRIVSWARRCVKETGLKGWDERNGGNLTLRLVDADIEPFAADFQQKARYMALS
ncbi:hypothetical protein ACVGXY_05970, partial [Enterobacter intestinihominis]